ncbi:hypothetical protein [Galbibacter sp.]|jgi:pimeloyl-CoA synthetase|uniref:hypothetical protein n=1 Tax=Galbibacter sp. TaxID=2918471 RepID=UPI003A8DF6D6
MITKQVAVVLTAITLSLVTISCKDDKKEQQILDQKIEAIEATEAVIDSTVQQVDEKADEVEAILKDIDSL